MICIIIQQILPPYKHRVNRLYIHLIYNRLLIIRHQQNSLISHQRLCNPGISQGYYIVGEINRLDDPLPVIQKIGLVLIDDPDVEGDPGGLALVDENGEGDEGIGAWGAIRVEALEDVAVLENSEGCHVGHGAESVAVHGFEVLGGAVDEEAVHDQVGICVVVDQDVVSSDGLTCEVLHGHPGEGGMVDRHGCSWERRLVGHIDKGQVGVQVERVAEESEVEVVLAFERLALEERHAAREGGGADLGEGLRLGQFLEIVNFKDLDCEVCVNKEDIGN